MSTHLVSNVSKFNQWTTLDFISVYKTKVYVTSKSIINLLGHRNIPVKIGLVRWNTSINRLWDFTMFVMEEEVTPSLSRYLSKDEILRLVFASGSLSHLSNRWVAHTNRSG